MPHLPSSDSPSLFCLRMIVTVHCPVIFRICFSVLVPHSSPFKMMPHHRRQHTSPVVHKRSNAITDLTMTDCCSESDIEIKCRKLNNACKCKDAMGASAFVIDVIAPFLVVPAFVLFSPLQISCRFSHHTLTFLHSKDVFDCDRSIGPISFQTRDPAASMPAVSYIRLPASHPRSSFTILVDLPWCLRHAFSLNRLASHLPR